MNKPSKVVFISDELERDFNELKKDNPIKKGLIRAIKDLKEKDRKSTRLNSSHIPLSRMPSSA